MKTPKEWVDENSQSGPFDALSSCREAEDLVRRVQEDAMTEKQEEIRNLRAALKPFAALFDSDDEVYRDAKLTNATIPIRDVQAARAALKGESLS